MKEKLISRSYRYMAGVWRKNLFCVPCVWQLFPWQERGVILFSLFYSSSRIHIRSHTQSRGRNCQACAGARSMQLLRCWSTDRENKDGRSFSTLPCLTWATDVNNIVNKMWLYSLTHSFWSLKNLTQSIVVSYTTLDILLFYSFSLPPSSSRSF